MIPILYDSTETAFTSNGIGRLAECIKCVVTEERNGVFECEFQYPITGKRYTDIVEGMYIFCTHDDTGKAQPFEIYARSAPINGVVTFYARHISYKLNNIVLSPFSAGSVTEVMAEINEYSINTNPFTFWTDKSTVANFSLDNPSSVRGILGGSQGSLLDVYGGEYEFDMFTVKLHSARGAQTDVTIRYGKNLTDLKQEIDNGGAYDAVVPYWKQEDTLVMLDEKVVEGSHGRGRLAALDLTSSFQNQPTKAQLKSRAQSYLNSNKPWIPDENIKINFVALWQTTQYKDFAVLQRVKLCDTISVYYPALGVTANNVKVIKVKYNVLLDRYDEIELGDARSSFAQTLLKQASDSFGSATAGFVKTSAMQKAIDHATKLITGGLGGHVVFNLNADGEPEEILVMDTADTSTAVNVIRINANGIGFSTNGYNGPFNTAWTSDGAFVADFITTGTLNANLIKTGVLADTNNNTMFNLSTGELTMKKGSINLGDGAFSVSNAGALVAKNATLNGELTSITDVSWGKKYTRLKDGRFEAGSVSGNTYTRYGYVDGLYTQSETSTYRTLVICGEKNSVYIGAKNSIRFYPYNQLGGNLSLVDIFVHEWDTTQQTMYVRGGVTIQGSLSAEYFSADDFIFYGDGVMRKSLDIRGGLVVGGNLEVKGTFKAKDGASISTVYIPLSMDSDGTVHTWQEMKIVNGILTY